MQMSAEIVLHDGTVAVAAALMDVLGGTVVETAEAIAVQTRANMYPGYAYKTGAMQKGTVAGPDPDHPGDPRYAVVHVAADYAGHVEFGHVGAGGKWVGARPFLAPAVALTFPNATYQIVVRRASALPSIP